MMHPEWTAKIDVTKILKEHMFRSDRGPVYLDIACFPNKDGGKGRYGDDGFVVQSIGKEARAAGEKGPIIGNWKHVEGAGPSRMAADADPVQPDDDESIPF